MKNDEVMSEYTVEVPIKFTFRCAAGTKWEKVKKAAIAYAPLVIEFGNFDITEDVLVSKIKIETPEEYTKRTDNHEKIYWEKLHEVEVI